MIIEARPWIHSLLQSSYDQALAVIVDQADAVEQELVPLVAGVRRVTAAEICAELPDPGYDQSLRDGFVIGKSDRSATSGSASYQIKGEIPAGRCDIIKVGPGESFRIMTGGMVPVGAERVVQQEDCFSNATTVEVPEEVLNQQPSFYSEERILYSPGKCRGGQGKVAWTTGDWLACNNR